jgi:hypothetical protein
MAEGEMAAMPQPLDEWQELLLVDLVVASRKLPEHEQTDFVVIEPLGTSGTCLLRHAGLEPGYATHPLHLVMLESWGFIQFTNEAPGIWSVVLSRRESPTTRTSSGAVYAAPSRAGGTRSADRIRARCPPGTRTSSLGAWRSWTGPACTSRTETTSWPR